MTTYNEQMCPYQCFQHSRLWPVMFSKLCLQFFGELLPALWLIPRPLCNNPLINMWLPLNTCIGGNCIVMVLENRPLCLTWHSSLHTGLSAWPYHTTVLQPWFSTFEASFDHCFNRAPITNSLAPRKGSILAHCLDYFSQMHGLLSVFEVAGGFVAIA